MKKLRLFYAFFRPYVSGIYYYIRFYSLRKKLFSYLSSSALDDKKQVYYYIKRNRFIHTLAELVFPYEFVKKYRKMEIDICNDGDNRLYIKYCDKKMYFKKGMNIDDVKEYWINILVEQDMDSPHRYPIERYDFSEKIVADCGAAEGCFALSVIDQVKHLYLFESDGEWAEALEKTFQPFKEKVTIINKFVGKENDEKNISIDEYFEDKSLDCIKADIEGAEVNMLLGGEHTFKNKIKISMICTYHRHGDAENIKDILKKYGFFSEFVEKYVLFIHDLDGLREPYLRHALSIGEK